MKKKTAIAIDGPGGAGKSTLARAIAEKLGYRYVDTGAMYRTIGLYVLRSGADPHSADEVVPLLKKIKIDIDYNAEGAQTMMLNGEDVTGLIRTAEISMYASAVSAIPEVRAFLLDTQRGMAKKHDVIMDGRDIGTVILPDAKVKIFLTAAAEVRAQRRWKELREKGSGQSFEEVLKEINERDAADSGRAVAPLKPAEDAVTLDTTGMDIDQALRAACEIIERKTKK
ncbi:MAG: (d)CMP kinase [Oscillospiraceae bacterium]|nr:(d)CMP kinase [Oscillospiraceae bacterium]